MTDVVGLSRAADFAVAVAGAAPGDAEIAAGLLTDLATELRRDSSTAATGDGMLGRLAAPAGGLFAELAAAYMLDRRLIEAIDYGEPARALPIAATDRSLQCHIDATLGSVLVFAGRMDEGWRLLEGSIARATEARLELQAARGYRMIGSSASVLVEYERATRWLVAGVAYTERVERFNDRHYMAAHLGHVLWATGDWNAAVEMAEHARPTAAAGSRPGSPRCISSGMWRRRAASRIVGWPRPRRWGRRWPSCNGSHRRGGDWRSGPCWPAIRMRDRAVRARLRGFRPGA